MVKFVFTLLVLVNSFLFSFSTPVEAGEGNSYVVTYEELSASRRGMHGLQVVPGVTGIRCNGERNNFRSWNACLSVLETQEVKNRDIMVTIPLLSFLTSFLLVLLFGVVCPIDQLLWPLLIVAIINFVGLIVMIAINSI